MARRKQAHKLQFTIMQASRNTIPVWLTLLFITFPAWSKAPAQLWAGWVLLAGAAYMARNRYLLAGRDLARVEQAPQGWGRRLFTSTVLLGGLIAAGPSLLFPHLDDIGRMYVTMLLVCWLAAAMTSLGAWPRLYIAYVCLFNAGLALAWWRAGSAGSVYAPQILAMLALHAMLLVGFARSFAQQFDQSIDVRFANEALVEQVTLAREAAEKASDAKSRFLAVASHDLRQPLHAVTLLNGMLSRPQPQERVAEISHQMGRSLCAMESMFNSVLDFSKIEAARVVPRSAWHRLDPLFERLADDYGVLAAQKGLQLRMQAQALEIFTDAQLLERMLRNMLDNAVKFTARGAVALEARMDAEALVLTVSDSGPGIPANLREAVFGEYYQASGGQVHAGLGLGLAIVRRLAGLLQMSVEVRDALPQGARFELTIQAGQVRAAQQGGSVERSDVPVGAGASQSDLRGFFCGVCR